MHIGIEATVWLNNRGYGRHARALFSALIQLDQENRYTLFLDSATNEDTLPERAEKKLVNAKAPTAVSAAANGRRSLRDMWRMSQTISGADCDLLLFPTVYSYIPVLSRAKKIVMIHDIIAETYPQMTLPSPTARLFWKTKVALGRRQADAIVTVSDYSRQGIAAHFHMPEEQIHVVSEASDPVFGRLEKAQFTSKMKDVGLSDSQRHIIYVGGFGPHKNLETLINAFANLAQDDTFADARLVMVGEYKKEVFYSEINILQQQIQELNIQDKVIFTGYLSDEELVILLNLATVLALPSLMEGFGLPAVEAAACGCPVIATTASPLPALLGEGGIFIDPTNTPALQDALVQVLRSEDRQRQMRQAGLQAAQSLTWPDAAQQMLDVIHRVSAS
ncbi:MAG: glycosyltransferase family 4 protein [Chloroflexi bacterium]|nr:glycosyltransferase family 4 protein [Chloroflexota bacterium]